MPATTTIYTIGHSTRSIAEFIKLLKEAQISQLIDIRTIPKSRHNPQFGQAELLASLNQSDINYVYIKELGGLRPAVKNSINTAWRNKSFRNYADYMQTSDYQQGLAKLIKLARAQTSAIMCAEAVPWRCHRSLVADSLSLNNFQVIEIISSTSQQPHKLTSFAVVNGKQLTYPGN